MASPKSSKEKTTQRLRKLDGRVIRAVLFNGKSVGQGKFMAAAELSGELILDSTGGAQLYSQTGQLE